MSDDVFVVVGLSSIGQAVARRMGSGATVVLADSDEATLSMVAAAMRADGYDVKAHPVDVSSHHSVAELASAAALSGRIMGVAHTSSLSPARTTAADILAHDLFGIGYVVEEFGHVIAPGGAGLVVSGMAGHLVPPLEPDEEMALTSTPADELPYLSFLGPDQMSGVDLAYGIAKRASHLRVQGASKQWGRRGARLNTISPCIVSAPAGQRELDSVEHGDFMRAMVEASASGRPGTADEIAAVAAFLLGPDASFVTGTDVLVDGGVVASLRSGFLDQPVVA